MTNSEARKRHATPPTPDALDAIRARVEAATKEPWEHSLVSIDTVEDEYVVQTEAVADVVCRLDRAGEFIEHPMASARADAEFIAHARTDIPLLLAALDEAQAEFRHWSDIATDEQAARQAAEEYAESLGDLNGELAARLGEAQIKLTAAESARDAAEGAIERVRARMEEIAVMWECEPHVERLDVHRQVCPGCHRADVIRAALAPVTTDEVEGGGE